MPASWCWLVAGTTLSDNTSAPTSWVRDPLLGGHGKSRKMKFLRSAWDESSAEHFGPWRIGHNIDPAKSQDDPHIAIEEVQTETAVDPPSQNSGSDSIKTQQDPGIQADPETIKNIENLAYKRGLVAGRQLELSATSKQREEERELIRHLSIELRSLQQDPARFYEPLKKLALHLAEVLVRNELQTSPKAINALIEACVGQLDTHSSPVTVNLSPGDFQMIRSMGEAVSSQLNLVEDGQLRPGSVRARVADTMVQDLIEHRLEALARKVLADPESWLSRSSFTSGSADNQKDDAVRSTWRDDDPNIVDVDSKSGPTEAEKPEDGP